MKSTIILTLLIVTGISSLNAQETIRWQNPLSADFPVVQGRAWQTELSRPYDRLPAKAEKTVRTEVWNLSHNTAGEYIDFTTNAKEIVVRYAVSGGLNMPHMPSTGVSGVDLYAKDKQGEWHWARGKYNFSDTITYRFTNIQSATPLTFFRLYLPLYNTVKWLEIGTPEKDPVVFPKVGDKKPLVLYGTSILQGACASRPGLAWTNILGRKLDLPVINLGFSGNGRLEPAVTDLLNEAEASVFVLDCLPNLTARDQFPDDTVRARIQASVKSLQSKHPATPILLTEHSCGIASVSLDSATLAECERVNKVLQRTFTDMKSSGIKNIYLLTAKAIGLGAESTVDGIHPNDIGMMQHATAYEKAIRQILSRK
ncbi:SGNH/GDSL hydrolase family protein [Danxiaibacter flavus]|uniref:SGNH/GDSL hydrolase family protein n=1 Tax=Danxiaibacter flavus TaxID=3049108 RepID=A0ABV3ZMC8_9BACT|nr:SGNH/GDSL hydrolase family protein [Chitinophagaceae bacterium DXS]